VDSGADNCLFPARQEPGNSHTDPALLRILGHDSRPSTGILLKGRIEIGIWDSHASAFTFGLDAGFCSTLEHTRCGLLGQNGFFSRFKVTIDHANRYFDVGETFA